MTVQINQGRACHSSNYSSRGGAAIEYIVIHYTAGNGDTAAGNCSYFANGARGASAHYFVGEDGIYQSVPDSMRAWHCGGASVYKHPRCRNANSIGIELCSRKNAAGEYYFANAVVKQAISLTRQLMREYAVPASNVLRHYDVWDKCCPAPFVRYPAQWESFKAGLYESGDEEMTTQERAELAALKAEVSVLASEVARLRAPEMIYDYIDENMPEWARGTVKKLCDRGFLKGSDTGLDLDGEMLRILVILDRAGAFGE